MRKTTMRKTTKQKATMKIMPISIFTDKYQQVSYLQKGKYSKVYLYQNYISNEYVAVKIIQKHKKYSISRYTNKIYNEITNPIGFTFLSSGAPNGADYLYDINNNKEYNRNSRDLKKLTRREILMIERNNEEIKNAYIKEHGMKITKGGFKSRRNKNPHKKTKRRVRFTNK